MLIHEVFIYWVCLCLNFLGNLYVFFVNIGVVAIPYDAIPISFFPYYIEWGVVRIWVIGKCFHTGFYLIRPNSPNIHTAIIYSY